MTHCPECRGVPELLLVKRDRLVKRCAECGHRWNEERETAAVEFVGRGGWVRLRVELEPGL